MDRDDCYVRLRTEGGFADRLVRRLESNWRGGRSCPVLRPLGWLYGLGASVRRKLYGPVFKVRRASGPVMSIGNLTVGGSGKTPMCLALARLLLDRGHSPAVLSRGYGRRPEAGLRPPLVVSRGAGPEIPPETAGDEPWLMARELPELRVVVDSDRLRGAETAVNDLGADILILDDGFQHLRLAADCRILMIPAREPFGNGAILPAGPLREPVKNHRLADILVTAGAPVPSPETLELAEGRPVFAAEYRASGWRPAGGGALEPPDNLGGRPVFAFCGLGRPDSFLRSLRALGLNLRRFTPLRDHQVYDRPTLNGLLRDFTACGAEIMVTTVKDAVKIPAGFPWPVKALEMDLVLDAPEAFLGEVLRIIGRRGSGS